MKLFSVFYPNVHLNSEVKKNNTIDHAFIAVYQGEGWKFDLMWNVIWNFIVNFGDVP